MHHDLVQRRDGLVRRGACASARPGPLIYVLFCAHSCLWGPPELDTVANTEGEMVAWCTREGHGTRLIPEGALQGVQFLRTPHYIQVRALSFAALSARSGLMT